MNAPVRNASRLTVRRRVAYSLLLTTCFFVFLEGVLLVAGVAPATRARDPFVGFESSLPLFVDDDNEDRDLLRTADHKLRYFNDQQFSRTKGSQTFRVFCLGGSTTFGRPYDDRTSFAGWLRELLPSADPRRDWEVINAGGVSYASYRVATVVDELVDYSPDLFIIYSGHNEFLEERTYGQIRNLPASSRRVATMVAGTRTFAVLDRLLGGSNVEGSTLDRLPAEVDAILDHSVGPDAYQRDEALSESVLEHYEFNLRRMIATARSVGAKVLLVTPAANVKDFSPFKSQHWAPLPAAERARWSTLMVDAERFAEAGDVDAALSAYRQAASIDDGRADLHFRIGRLLHGQQRFQQAHQAFERAIELDVCPLRMLPAMRRIVEQVAISQRVPLVDFHSVVASDCQTRFGHSSPGNEYFLDHVHPTVASHRLLALSIVDAMMQTGTVKPSPSWGEEAIAHVSAEIESRVDDELRARALTNLAQVLSWAGKQQEAAPLALTAVELRSRQGLGDDAEALFYAAVGFAVDGRDEQAIDWFERVIELEPDNAQAHWRLAALRYDALQFDQAEHHFREAIRLNPNDVYSHRMLASVMKQFARRDQALELLKRAALLDPQDETIRDDIKRIRDQMRRS